MTYIFPSTLIVSHTDPDLQITILLQSLDHQLNPNNPDLKIIDTDWSINEIRTIKNFLSQKPYNHLNKVVIVKDAHNLAAEAQNALLKILEEPGPNNYLILVTNQPSSLLNTIHSRCHLIKLSGNLQPTVHQLLKISPSVKDNLFFVDQLGLTKDTALPFIENQLSLFQQQLVKKPNSQTAYLIQKLIRAIQMIKANVDPRSSLDYFFLS